MTRGHAFSEARPPTSGGPGRSAWRLLAAASEIRWTGVLIANLSPDGGSATRLLPATFAGGLARGRPARRAAVRPAQDLRRRRARRRQDLRDAAAGARQEAGRLRYRRRCRRNPRAQGNADPARRARGRSPQAARISG